MSGGALFLSRLQFVWVIAWHILLPAFTVGLASYIAVLEGLYLLTHRDLYFRLSNFWTRIFAVSFGMGVVSGITMPFAAERGPHAASRKRRTRSVTSSQSFAKRAASHGCEPIGTSVSITRYRAW